MFAALSTRTSRSLEDVRYDVKRFLREESARGKFWSGEVSGVTSYMMERAVVRKPCFMLEATQPATMQRITTQPTTTQSTTTQHILTQTATQTDAREEADEKAQISRLKEQLAAAEKSISDASNQTEEAEKHEILIATSLQNMNKHIRRLQEEEISAQSRITFLQSEVLRQQSMAINTQMDYQMMLAPHNDFSAPHDAHFFASHGVDFPVVETHQSRNRHAREESRDLPLRPPPSFTPFRADDTFEGLDHLFAGLGNVADEANIPTERSTTNILDQNLPAPTAKPTVNDFGNLTDAVAWMNKHKQCLICGQPRNKPTPLHNITDAQHLSYISFSIMTARRSRIYAVGALWQDATVSAS
jgi:hypothetical protein